ncbi:MAG: hypothetical protein K0B37_00695 [Bacteroidales bacterium]|nr:hypothetical protein [Bacteroidales bacterium]
MFQTYIEILNRNPSIPFFILEEINKNPERLANAFVNAGLPIQKVFDMITDAAQKGIIRPVDPNQLIINLISMSVFPLVGRNMIQPVLFQNDKRAYNKFLESQKAEVADFIIQSIQITKD